MPIKLMKTESVARPTIAQHIPMRASNGDNAEVYNFRNHNAGEGQCNRTNSKILVSAAKELETTARI